MHLLQFQSESMNAMKKKKRLRNLSCEEVCVICGGEAVYHHIKSFGSGGLTEIKNLIPLCTLHHNEIHTKGTVKFIYDNWLYDYMINKGWEICPLTRKWRMK